MKNFFQIDSGLVLEKIALKKRSALPPKPPKKEKYEETDEEDPYADVMNFTPVEAPYLKSLSKKK